MIGCHQVSQCQRPECGHLFSTSAETSAGEMTPEDSAANDLNEFGRRNRALITRWQADNFLRPGDGVLDIGAGTGHIASALRDSGLVSVSCVETGDALRSDLCQNGFQAYASIDVIPEEVKTNCALMIEVIEHLDDPVSVLRQIHTRLQMQHGRMFLTTPAGGARQKNLIFRIEQTYRNPQHVQFFTPKSLEYALRKAGFTQIAFRYMPEMMASYTACAGWKYTLIRLRQWLKYHLAGVRHLTLYAR